VLDLSCILEDCQLSISDSKTTFQTYLPELVYEVFNPNDITANTRSNAPVNGDKKGLPLRPGRPFSYVITLLALLTGSSFQFASAQTPANIRGVW
jgi:hypothetical protein